MSEEETKTSYGLFHLSCTPGPVVSEVSGEEKGSFILKDPCVIFVSDDNLIMSRYMPLGDNSVRVFKEQVVSMTKPGTRILSAYLYAIAPSAESDSDEWEANAPSSQSVN